MELPKKKYKIIYADPPWKYCNKTVEECKDSPYREVERYYNTMKTDDICNLPIKDLADNDCVLFMWGTYPKLPEVLEVIKAWGFTYKSIAFQWVKLNRDNGQPFYGLGRWTRGNTEPCLIATKGKPKRISNSVFQLIQSKIRGHSRKPDEARNKIIELMGDLPRIELFARNKREGWDTWGNQVLKDTQKVL